MNGVYGVGVETVRAGNQNPRQAFDNDRGGSRQEAAGQVDCDRTQNSMSCR